MEKKVGKRRTKISSIGKRALTIVELLVTLVIIAVLATMVVPRFSGAAASGRLRESARRLLVTARYARDFAATHRCEVRLIINTEENTYSLEYQPDPEHQPGDFQPVPQKLGRTEQLDSKLQFGDFRIAARDQEADFFEQQDYVTFSPTGQADAAVIQLTNSRRTYSVLVAPASGRINLAEGAVTELPNDRLDLDAELD